MAEQLVTTDVISDGRSENSDGRSRKSWASVVATIGGSVLVGGFFGYQLGQDSSEPDPVADPHPTSLTAVYEVPYDQVPENITGYAEGSFDIVCGYYSPENSPPSGHTGLKPDYLFVEGTTPQDDQIVGFVKFIPGMLRPGEFGNCADAPIG
jgi:hypothetical protein